MTQPCSSRSPSAATPRALDTAEIPDLVAQFRAAARRALDGVKIRFANGYLLHRVSSLGLAYLHALINPETSFCQLDNLADRGVISAATVGRAYLATPDLIDRLRWGAELTEPDVVTFYSPGRVGYTDYPTLTPAGRPACCSRRCRSTVAR